jgi:TonB family protein
MKLILLLLAMFSLMNMVSAQDTVSPSLVQASLKQSGTVSGDTTYYKHPTGLGRYFNRNLRMPLFGQGNMQTGTCRLSFIIDTLGKVGNVSIEETSNKAVGKEVLSVAKKMGKLTPTLINGVPVNTQVSISFGFYAVEPDAPVVKRSEDILVMGYTTVRVRN